MQAQYKLLASQYPLLVNDDSSKPVPGYDSGHTLGTGDSPNGHQITASCMPLRTQTYTEVVACLKKVKMGPDAGPVNRHQLLSVSRPELTIKLDSSGDVKNKSIGTKYSQFCSPELAKPEFATLKSFPQVPGPVKNCWRT
ncbi:hypothetical protein DSO57_1002607 [Entomophthora muscae]|uniref:Uncharacterized protein n=1 Tax=Entomophthora muscae TaxID=34485 RepID=A0ACC2U7Y6_9FUNG|nr:hypothetical protein DSO57_1002607 [Entomophthora muscae]